MSEQNATKTSVSAPSDQESNYTMVIAYAVIIVIIIVLILYTGGEYFNTKPVRSDLQGGWDIVSELSRLNKTQEELLANIHR